MIVTVCLPLGPSSTGSLQTITPKCNAPLPPAQPPPLLANLVNVWTSLRAEFNTLTTGRGVRFQDFAKFTSWRVGSIRWALGR